jgi:predicted enzyme related to lactoylglutathione lyase
VILAALLSGCAAVTYNLPPIAESGIDSVSGRVVWRDLISDTPAATERFYSTLFGWEFRDAGVDGYKVILHDGQPIAGLVDQTKLPARQDISQWISVFSTPELESALARASDAGGRVLTPPTSLGERGRVAVVEDGEGVAFALLDSRGRDPREYEQLPPPGSFLWTELWSADVAAAADFYQTLAGYEVAPPEIDEAALDVSYRILRAGGQPRAGIRSRPDKGIQPMWVNYVRIADGDALQNIVGRVPELGGEVLVPPTPRPAGGEVAIIRGPSGAGFALQTWNSETLADRGDS